MFGNTRPSLLPSSFTQDDYPPQRRPFQQDDTRSSPFQRNDMFRPSGKSIYMKRKDYSESLNRKSDNFQVRVEHLFTCDLDGYEVKTVDDCVTKLKTLDEKGRLWLQQMIMEVQGGYLLLSDIETKAQLESLPLSLILQTRAVLDSCAYNSVLAITVQDRNKRVPQVYMFQCEETGADHIKSDLDKAALRGGVDVEPRREQSDIRSDLENIIGQRAWGSPRQAGPPPPPPPMQRERTPPPPELPPPMWNNRDPDDMIFPRVHTPQEPPYGSDLHDLQGSLDIPMFPDQAEIDRNTEILNHVLNDMEIFTDQVSAAAVKPVTREDKSKKKNKKNKKSNRQGPLYILPPTEEYISCLQKIKYGFNLLGELDGKLAGPTATDYVHIFFDSIDLLVNQYPPDLPPTVVSPLLTEAAMRLLDRDTTSQEDVLWRALGDSWNIPRTRWPDDNIPIYIPGFYDGWQVPAPLPVRRPSPLPAYRSSPLSRSSSQRYPPMGHQHEEPMSNGSWGPPPPPPQQPAPPHPREPPVFTRAMYDFTARNNRELSILKGEEVEVIQRSNKWCTVRNARGEEGSVPQNVLEPMRDSRIMDDKPWESRGGINLNMRSTPAEVTAWLEYKGFSKNTVSTLGLFNGKTLLDMTKDVLRTVCPDEGGKVFFQLQGVKSAIALASEPSGMYNGRY